MIKLLLKLVFYPLILLVFLLVGGIAYLHWGDLGNHREFIEKQASKALGREVQIAGIIDLNISSLLELELGEVSIENAEWSKKISEKMLELSSIKTSLNLFGPLLGRGVYAVESLDLKGLNLLVDSKKSGESNWSFGSDDSGETKKKEDGKVPSFSLKNVNIQDAKIRLPKTDISIGLKKASLDESTGKLKLGLSGSYNQQAIQINANSEPVSEIISDYLSGKKALPILLDAKADSLSLKANGSLNLTKPLNDTNLKLSLLGDTLDPAENLAKIELPSFKNFDLKTDLRLANKTAHLNSSDFKLEKSDLSGDFSYSWKTDKPSIVAKLSSDLLDVTEVSSPFKKEEKDSEGLDTEELEAEKTALQKNSEDTPSEIAPSDETADTASDDFDIAGFLNSMNIDSELNLKRVDLDEKQSISDLGLKAALEDGVLKTESFKLKYFGGEFDSNIQADASQSPAQFDFKLGATDFNLTECLDSLASSGGLRCSSDINIDLASRGDKLSQVKGNLEGDIGVYAEDGEFDNRLMKILMVGLQDILSPLFESKPEIALHCVKVDIAIKDGILDPSQSVIFSEVVKAFFDGTVNLTEGEVDMRVSVATSSPSVASLVPPFSISGPFDNLSVLPSLLGTVGDIATSGFKVADGAVGKLVEQVSSDEELKGMAYCNHALEDKGKIMPVLIGE